MRAVVRRYLGEAALALLAGRSGFGVGVPLPEGGGGTAAVLGDGTARLVWVAEGGAVRG